MDIPFFRLTFDERGLREMEESLRSGWITTGPKVREFEQRFLDAVAPGGGRHAVAVNSCTAALHLAAEAIGLTRGELVLVPAMTFTATAEIVRYFDATPVLVDVEPDTMNMSVEHLRRTLSRIRGGLPVPGANPPHGRVRAVIPVHYGGQPCDMEAIRAAAREFDCDVIEDAAHAFPAGWSGADGTPPRRVGDDSSRVTCFSFYANKTITTGEGGMAVTADADLAARMRLMSLHGMNKDAWRRFEKSGTWDYRVVAPGFKYNMTDIAAGLGLAQLARADEFRDARRGIADAYDAAFADDPRIEPLARRDGLLHAHHLYVVRLRTDRMRISRDETIERMRARGIACVVHYRPLHLHPYYADTYGLTEADFPNASAAWPRLLSLPLFPSMSDEEVRHVIDSLTAIAAGD